MADLEILHQWARVLDNGGPKIILSKIQNNLGPLKYSEAGRPASLLCPPFLGKMHRQIEVSKTLVESTILISSLVCNTALSIFGEW